MCCYGPRPPRHRFEATAVLPLPPTESLATSRPHPPCRSHATQPLNLPQAFPIPLVHLTSRTSPGHGPLATHLLFRGLRPANL